MFVYSHSSTLILPLSPKLIDDAEALRFRLSAQGSIEKDSDILIVQLRAIDNKRILSGPLMQYTDSQLDKIYQLVAQVMGVSLI